MSDGEFVHQALLYRDASEYLDGTLPFIEEALDADEPILVAVPASKLKLLTNALGGRAAKVRMHDVNDVGRNPGRLVPWLYFGFARANPDVRVHMIGEPLSADRMPDAYPACVQHEAVSNIIFAGRSSRGLCPYDVSNLDPDMITDVRATHPLLVDAGIRQPSPDYADPLAVAAAFNRPLPDLGRPLLSLDFDATTLGDLRRVVAQHAAYAGMEPERRTALHDAVAEVAANSVEHGGGSGRLTLYRQPDAFVCDISDFGWIADPLAGRIPADSGEETPGLVLVHLLCDLVRTHTTPSGTTTRLYMRLPSRVG